MSAWGLGNIVCSLGASSDVNQLIEVVQGLDLPKRAVSIIFCALFMIVTCVDVSAFPRYLPADSPLQADTYRIELVRI